MAYFREGGGLLRINNEDIFARHIIVDNDKSETIRKRFNNKDCYLSIYKYDSQEQENANLMGSFYLDLDYKLENTNDLMVVQYDLKQIVAFFRYQCDIPQEFINIYFSGCKGYHILIDPIVFGINEPDKDLNLKFKQFATYILENTTNFKTIDTRIYDRVRLFRMINSINGKTNLYKVKVNFDFASNCKYDELLNYARTPKLILKSTRPYAIPKAIKKFNDVCNEANKSYNVIRNIKRDTNYEMSECIKQMLTSSAPEGTRNNTCIALASSLLQCGKTSDETLEILLNWNESYNSPKLNDKEITAVVKSAVKEIKADHAYGCTSIKDLGYCLGAICKLYKGNK